jgi:hypothetical protein
MTNTGDNNDIRKVKRSIGVPSFLIKYVYQPEFIWYSIGLIIRILSTLVYPQQGYIHPVRKNILKYNIYRNSLLG